MAGRSGVLIAGIVLASVFLGGMLVAQALPWGRMDVNLIFARAEFDVYPWGAHYEFSGFGESESDTVNWYTGSTDLEDEAGEDDEASMSVNDDYTSDSSTLNAEAVVSATFLSTTNGWRADIEMQATSLGNAEQIRISRLAVRAEGTFDEGEEIAAETVDFVLLAGQTRTHSMAFDLPGDEEYYLSIDADVIAEVKSSFGQPVSDRDSNSYDRYDFDAGYQGVDIEFEVSGEYDHWLIGDVQTISLTATASNFDDVVSARVTKVLIEVGSASTSRDLSMNFTGAGSDSAAFDLTPTSGDGYATVEFHPTVVVEFTDGTTETFGANNIFYFLDLRVTYVSSQVEMSTWFADTALASEPAEASEAHSAMLQASHPASVLAILLAIPAVPLAAQRLAKPTVAGGLLIASSAVATLALILFGIGSDGLFGDTGFYDFSWGFGTMVLMILAGIAGAIVLLVAGKTMAPAASYRGTPGTTGRAASDLKTSATTRTLRCPRCAASVLVSPGAKPVCGNCGFGA